MNQVRRSSEVVEVEREVGTGMASGSESAERTGSKSKPTGRIARG